MVLCRLARAWTRMAAMLTALAAPAAAAIPQSAGAVVLVEVRDASGAPVQGVVVSVVAQDTAATRAGTTFEDGTTWIVRLPAGTYTLTAVRGGFKTRVIRDIHVDASARSRIAVMLEPGDYNEHVVVTADAATLRIGNGAVGAAFGARTLLALPSETRDVLNVALQAPGVAPPAPGSRLSTQGNAGLNSAGAREASNNFLLDGLDNNDQFLNRLVINPSLDAIQEFSVLQNTYDAEYGRSAGAQLNVVLKSGTDTRHGTVYEFFRHSALDARDALASAGTATPLRQRHQFGGTSGGRIPIPKSYYFVSAEATSGREAETRLAHVPTDAERSGDFSDSGVTIRDPLSGLPFPGNVIPTARLSAAGVMAANLYPSPNRDEPQRNYAASPLARRGAVQFTVKTDHSVWRSSPLTFRYSYSRDARDQPYPARGRNLPGFGISVLDRGHHAGVGLATVLTPHVFIEMRLGLNALARDNTPQRAGTDGFSALGMSGPPLDRVDLGYPTLVVPGFETLGDDPNLPVARRTRTWHSSNAFTIDRGRHQIKAGGELRTYRSDGYSHLFPRGQAAFQGIFTGSPVGDLLLGLPSIALLGVNDNRQALRTWAVNGFVQDDWRPSRRLTINAGVRYELNARPYDADDRMSILDPGSLTLRAVGRDGVPRSGLRADYNDVAPRLGLRWDLTGNGRWVLRGGYGVFYDAGTLIENSALYFNPPHFSLQLFFPGASPLTLANPFPSGRGLAPRPSVNTLDPGMRDAYAQQATAGVEGVVFGSAIAARYVTARGSNLVRKRNLNQPTPGPGALDPRRPLPAFADILLVESTASSTYHAMQLSATRGAGRRVSARAAYTLAKSMDDTSAFLATDGDDNTPQNSRNLAAEWGPSDFDVRHRLVVAVTAETPTGSRWAVARNWQASAVFTAQSGRPFTPRVSFDNSNTGNVGGGTFAYDRPDVLSGDAPSGARVATYGNRAFVVPPRYTFGNAGRNSLVGPGSATFDAAISRGVPLGARRTLTLRLEVFNALNRANYQLPDSFVDRATFGAPLSAYPPRQAQLAARFSF